MSKNANGLKRHDNNLPLAKKKNIVIQKIGKETLLYEVSSNNAHCLNETAAHIWNNCDGKTTFEEFSERSDLPIEMIDIAIDRFKRANLLEGRVETQVPHDRVQRRQFLTRVASFSIVALPLITSLVAPPSSNAQSCLGSGQMADFPPPPTSPIATIQDCLNYCGFLCCSGASPSSSVTLIGTTCSCQNVICA